MSLKKFYLLILQVEMFILLSIFTTETIFNVSYFNDFNFKQLQILLIIVLLMPNRSLIYFNETNYLF